MEAEVRGCFTKRATVYAAVISLITRCYRAVNFAVNSKDNFVKSNSYNQFCCKFAVLTAKPRAWSPLDTPCHHLDSARQ